MSICCVYFCMFLLKQYWLQFVKKKSMRISTDIIVSYIIIIIYLFYFNIILLLYYFSLSKFVRFFFCSLLIIHPVKCSPNLSGFNDLTSLLLFHFWVLYLDSSHDELNFSLFIYCRIIWGFYIPWVLPCLKCFPIALIPKWILSWIWVIFFDHRSPLEIFRSSIVF